MTGRIQNQNTNGESPLSDRVTLCHCRHLHIFCSTLVFSGLSATCWNSAQMLVSWKATLLTLDYQCNVKQKLERVQCLIRKSRLDRFSSVQLCGETVSVDGYMLMRVFSLLSLGRITISKTVPTQRALTIKCQGTTWQPRHWGQLQGQRSCTLLSVIKLSLPLSSLLQLYRLLLHPFQPTSIFLRLTDSRKTSIALCLTPWNEISSSFEFRFRTTPRPQTPLEIPAAQWRRMAQAMTRKHHSSHDQQMHPKPRLASSQVYSDALGTDTSGLLLPGPLGQGEAAVQRPAVIFSSWHHLCMPCQTCWQSRLRRPLLISQGRRGQACNVMPIDFKGRPSLHAS